MGAALALAERARGMTWPNPPVGCVLVRDGIVVGRGWTRPGGRPHAEAAALAAARAGARGATAYVTLEPCAHVSDRGPACSDLLIAGGVARVVAALRDPDPRTAGQGLARLRAAGIETVEGVGAAAARTIMAGFLTRQALGRPHVTLKLATSLDGCIALPDGESRWITGAQARAHAHVERAKVDAILVGRATYDADRPRLDVRLPGLEDRAPARLLLSRSRVEAGPGWTLVRAPEAVAGLLHDTLLVEGGAATATAFLRADLVDRLMLYTAPILLGGRAALGDLGLVDLAAAHGRWRRRDERSLGRDRLQVFERRDALGTPPPQG